MPIQSSRIPRPSDTFRLESPDCDPRIPRNSALRIFHASERGNGADPRRENGVKELAWVPQYTRREEIANSVSHGVGLVLAIGGLAVLTGFASLYGTAWHVVACSVYGATLVLLYAASTLYHSIYFPRAKRVLRELDHSAIYLLIAGTYTPFTLVNLRGPWGWSLFGVVWGLATIGILLRLSGKQRGSVLPLVLYVVMGWVGVIGLKPLFDLVGPVGLSLVVAGGLAYTAGIIFYVWERLPYNHAVWHVFVLAGSAFQFFAVLFYVIPLAGRS